MRAWIKRHVRSLSAIVAVGVLVIAVGLYWFQPWELFIDDTVNEALPAAAVVAPSGSAPVSAPVSASAAPASASAAPGPVTRLLSHGSFVSHEHSTRGVASIVIKPDGSRVLAIAGLHTSNGPEVKVWLADAPLRTGSSGWYIFDDPGYHHVSLGALKGNIGNQVYPIPASADLSKLTTVTLWCDRFNVSFGAASLVAG